MTRLEATLPCDTTRFYPVCTGGKWPAPPEHVQDAQSYLALLDEHRYPSWDALGVLANVSQVLLEAPADVSIQRPLAIWTPFARRWSVWKPTSSCRAQATRGSRPGAPCGGRQPRLMGRASPYGYASHRGGVSNVDRDGKNTLEIKGRGVVISTVETLPISDIRCLDFAPKIDLCARTHTPPLSRRAQT